MDSLTSDHPSETSAQLQLGHLAEGLNVAVLCTARSSAERRAASVEAVVGWDPVLWTLLCLEMMISVFILGYQRWGSHTSAPRAPTLWVCSVATVTGCCRRVEDATLISIQSDGNVLVGYFYKCGHSLNHSLLSVIVFNRSHSKAHSCISLSLTWSSCSNTLFLHSWILALWTSTCH